MKQFYTVPLLSGLFLMACGNDSDPAPLTGSPVSSSTIADTCNCTEVITDSLGIHLKDGKPFTGTCESYYDDNGKRYLEQNMLEGKLHGKVSYYDREGNLILGEYYENGRQIRSGQTEIGLSCDCSELLSQTVQSMQVYKLDGIPFTGKCTKKYPESSQVYMESNYKNGLLNGYTIYYDREGETILMEKYENGEQVSSIH